jgi:hypothetical protein
MPNMELIKVKVSLNSERCASTIIAGRIPGRILC